MEGRENLSVRAQNQVRAAKERIAYHVTSATYVMKFSICYIGNFPRRQVRYEHCNWEYQALNGIRP